MKIAIRNRWNNALIFECEADTIREACEKATVEGKSLRSADLRFADLRSANLSSADLSSANLRSANLRSADLSFADLRSANLRSANLSSANLSSANLSSANLSSANLSSANLSSANLELIRTDFFDVLLRGSVNGEVPGLIAALKEGRVDGSTYTGECACLVGTLANIKGCNYASIPDLVPNSERPAEQFFCKIRAGDTPGTNQCSAIAVEWAEEFQRLIQRVKEHKSA